MLTISLLLAIAALICAIANAIGKAPLWVSVILLCVLALLQAIPLR